MPNNDLSTAKQLVPLLNVALLSDAGKALAEVSFLGFDGLARIFAFSKTFRKES
jgi:hypothetical protein